MADTELNINVFKWRLKVYRLSQLQMSAGRLFQIKTDECLKARDAMTVRVLLLLSNRLFDDRSVALYRNYNRTISNFLILTNNSATEPVPYFTDDML